MTPMDAVFGCCCHGVPVFLLDRSQHSLAARVASMTDGLFEEGCGRDNGVDRCHPVFLVLLVTRVVPLGPLPQSGRALFGLTGMGHALGMQACLTGLVDSTHSCTCCRQGHGAALHGHDWR